MAHNPMHHSRPSSQVKRVPIPLALLLHPVTNEFPYSNWFTDRQAAHGGIPLPLGADGFRICIEYVRAILRSPASDERMRMEAKRFAGEVYRINIGEFRSNWANGVDQHGTAPWLASSRTVNAEAGPSTSSIGRKRAAHFEDETPRVPLFHPTPPSTTSRRAREDGDGDEVMDMSSDSSGESVSTPSPERRRQLSGTTHQRASSAMKIAKTTNMRGQWREGSTFVPVPNSRGRLPPWHLPSIYNLATLRSLSDILLAMWLRFYDGDHAEMPATRYGREIALCTRLGVLWGGDRATESCPGSPPPQVSRSQPALSSPPATAMTRTATAPIITISPPTPGSSPPTSPEDPIGPLSAPPATPGYQYPSPSTHYSQTHPQSVALTYRHRRYSSAPAATASHTPETVADYRRPAHTPDEISTSPRRRPAFTPSPIAPSPISPTSVPTVGPSTPTSGYTYVVRHGFPYAVRWTANE